MTRGVERETLRDSLRAMIGAARELSPADDEHLVDAFLDDLEARIGHQVDTVSPRHPRSRAEAPSAQISWQWAVWGLLFVLAAGIILAASLRVTVGPLAALAVLILGVETLIGLQFIAFHTTNGRYITQEQGWIDSGTAPRIVVRTYGSDSLFQRDARRLVGLGYEIGVHRTVGGRIEVTYRRVGHI